MNAVKAFRRARAAGARAREGGLPGGGADEAGSGLPRDAGGGLPGGDRPRVETPRQGGASTRRTPAGPVGSVTDRVLRQLREGRTVRAIAATSGVSEVFVSTMLDHFERLGLLDEANSLCSSGLGACSTTELTDEARVACAGCPLVI
ncbi:MAG: hypothetical protein ACFNPY_09450 [Peptidiphaga sp.]